jgi:hypothetical protein
MYRSTWDIETFVVEVHTYILAFLRTCADFEDGNSGSFLASSIFRTNYGFNTIYIQYKLQIARYEVAISPPKPSSALLGCDRYPVQVVALCSHHRFL